MAEGEEVVVIFPALVLLENQLPGLLAGDAHAVADSFAPAHIRRADKHVHAVRPPAQHIVRSPSHKDGAGLLRDPRYHGALYAEYLTVIEPAGLETQAKYALLLITAPEEFLTQAAL